MCGIVGIYHHDGLNVGRSIIEKMSYAIVHRGPDGEGYHFDNHIYLASRRLSIIDLEGGDQPIYDETKNFCIVYNGEIYNYREIRSELRKKGHSFTTNTDTEVVLHSYMEWGVECLNILRGMFAFCIWDYMKKELFLARDRMGIKPLYYSKLSDGTFIFASEIKALLQYPGIEKRMYVKALDNLLTYGFNPAPHTFFEGVKQLLPGHYLKISAGGFVDEEYWDIDLNMPLFQEDEKELSQMLRYEIEKSIKSRLVADVPVAAYLSGGIDSSAVAGIYSRLSDQIIKTVSITFDHADYDESRFSRVVSKFFGTENSEFVCNIEPEAILNSIYHLEEPMVTLLNLPLFLLSAKVKENGLKVVLSGDGADEILGGYDYFKTIKAMEFIKRQESSFRKNILRSIFPNIKTSVHAEIQYMLFQEYPVKYPALPYRFQACPFKELMYSQKYKEDLSMLSEDNLFFFDLDKIAHRSLIDQALYIEVKMRLLNLTLPLADKMSMANSIELRPSFLDHDLVNFIFRIPDKYKINVLSEKYILKQSMKGFLPAYICERRKQPLQLPGRNFIYSAGEMIECLLSEKMIKEKGYFDKDFMKRILSEYFTTGREDYCGVIISSLFVHLWDEIFLN